MIGGTTIVLGLLGFVCLVLVIFLLLAFGLPQVTAKVLFGLSKKKYIK